MPKESGIIGIRGQALLLNLFQRTLNELQQKVEMGETKADIILCCNRKASLERGRSGAPSVGNDEVTVMVQDLGRGNFIDG